MTTYAGAWGAFRDWPTNSPGLSSADMNPSACYQSKGSCVYPLGCQLETHRAEFWLDQADIGATEEAHIVL
jgi:hypothetical protein